MGRDKLCNKWNVAALIYIKNPKELFVIEHYSWKKFRKPKTPLLFSLYFFSLSFFFSLYSFNSKAQTQAMPCCNYIGY